MTTSILPLVKEKQIRIFKERADASQSILTLGGTGPNGSIHALYLKALGASTVKSLAQINILSASAFAFFIFTANERGALNIDHYMNYDKWVRAKHKQPFLKILKHFSRFRLPDTPLYPHKLIKETIYYLFDAEFSELTLKDFEHKLRFWVYCSVSNKNLCLSAENFPHMTVWEAITASSSIPFVHGEFKYQGYSFRDGVFSPSFKSLLQTLKKTNFNHLYLNYKKNANRKRLLLVSNTDSLTPMIELVADYFMFICNIPNYRVNKTHRLLINQ